MRRGTQEKQKMYFYESFAEDFDSKMNMYDTKKRVSVVYDELLKDVDLKGKKLLDAGCGTGWFSKRAVERGAKVTSMDLGEKLLEQVARKCESERVVGSLLGLPFADNTFDMVVSSEVIEHTPDPTKGMQEMLRVLKPGGILILTTPNKFWYWSVWIANKMKLRPYQGLENWTGWWQMKKRIRMISFIPEYQCGIHLFPFVLKMFYPTLNFFHRFNRGLGPFMVNIAVRARKPGA